MNADPRVSELEELAASEGFRLPYPPDYIVWLEDRGRLVDLVTGEVIYARLVATPLPAAQAVVHLLAHEMGAVAL